MLDASNKAIEHREFARNSKTKQSNNKKVYQLVKQCEMIVQISWGNSCPGNKTPELHFPVNIYYIFGRPEVANLSSPQEK